METHKRPSENRSSRTPFRPIGILSLKIGTMGSKKIMKSVRMFMHDVVLNTINSSMHLPANCGAKNNKGLQAKATMNLSS